MMIGPAIYSILSGDTTITSITSVITMELSDQTLGYPQLVYKVADQPAEQTYNGPVELQETKLSIFCLGLSSQIIETLGKAVFDCLSLVAAGVYSGVAISAIFYEGSEDSVIARPQNQNQTLWQREQQWKVFFNVT
ncbi:MAG: hypothetical protein KGL39_28710 [Patescibacteria group bacterium]|nr:hypothetical protein [Patescibacteria group bacterium]